jgi:hypothetical protein
LVTKVGYPVVEGDLLAEATGGDDADPECDPRQDDEEAHACQQLADGMGAGIVHIGVIAGPPGQ